MYIFREEEGENVNFDVKFRNLESRTKKRLSEILADEKTYSLRKSHGKVSKEISEIRGKCFIVSGDGRPCPYVQFDVDIYYVVL